MIFKHSKLAMLSVLIAAAACSSTHAELKLKLPRAPWKKKKQEVKRSAYARPARMVVIWTPDVLTVPGKTPTRGVGGRIYFYNNENKTVSVEGQLMVYAYDESKQENAESPTPNRAYAFKPEDFASKFSESTIGASYNVWVPWDAQGGKQVKVELIPIFTAVNGYRVMGQPSEVILPGKQPESSPREHLGDATRTHVNAAPPQNATPPQVAPVAYQSRKANPPTPARAAFEAQRRRLRRTTTIDLPTRTARQLRKEPLQDDGILPAAAPRMVPNAGAILAPQPVINRFGGTQMSEASRNAAFPGRSVQMPGQMAQANAMPGTMNHGYGANPTAAGSPALRRPHDVQGASRSRAVNANANTRAATQTQPLAYGSTSQRLQQSAANARTWPTPEQRLARFAPNQYQAPTGPAAPTATSRGPSALPPSAPLRRTPPTAQSLFPAR